MSPEHLGMEVTQFYSQFLIVPPDSSSVNWVNDLESGRGADTVKRGLPHVSRVRGLPSGRRFLRGRTLR